MKRGLCRVPGGLLRGERGLGVHAWFSKTLRRGDRPAPSTPIAGGYWMLNCERVPAAIDEINNEMKQIQENCFDQARRTGVLPGRARLN